MRAPHPITILLMLVDATLKAQGLGLVLGMVGSGDPVTGPVRCEGILPMVVSRRGCPWVVAP